MDGRPKSMMRRERSAISRGLALFLGFVLGLSAAPVHVQASTGVGQPTAQLRVAQVPLEVDDNDVHRDMSHGSGAASKPDTVVSGAAPAGPPPPRIDPDSLPLQIAIGLGPSAPGSREELALVQALEASAVASSAPRTSVRRLHGGGDAKSVCRQRRDDLVLTVGYIADRDEAVLLTYDCVLDRALGIRPGRAAGDSGLVAALWSEHRSLIQEGAKQRRAPLVSRKTRKILIAGGATAFLGVALGLILASTLRPTTVVLTVGR